VAASTIISEIASGADTRVGQAVRACLRADCQTATLPIDIDVYNRIVFVHSVVPDPASVTEVTAVIERAPDVAEVIDQLDVQAQAVDEA
jgi:osmotically-inducible protein OsmY